MNMVSTKRLLFFMLFSCNTICFTQEKNYSVKGKILNEANGIPVNEANIYAIDLKNDLVAYKTKSDSTGNFQIFINKGNYNFSIGHNDFEVKLITIDHAKFKDNSMDLGEIDLKPLIINALEEVVVVAKDFRVENKNNKRIYHIGNTLRDVAGSMSNLLSYIPSISVDIDGTIQLRGRDPVVKINGRKSNLSKSEVLQMLPSDMIKKIEVITRPSLRDGETKPVINIITDRKRERLIGGVNLAFGLPSTTKGGIHLALNREKINGYGLYGIKRENNILSSKSESIRKDNGNSQDLEIESNDNNTLATNQFGELQYEYLPNKDSELVGNVSIFGNNSTLSTNGVRNTYSEDLEQTSQLNNSSNKLFSIITETEYERKFNAQRDRLKIELEYEYESRKITELFSEFSLNENNFSSNSYDRLISNDVELKSRYDWTIGDDDYLSVGYRFDFGSISQNQLFLSNSNMTPSKNNILFSQFDNTLFADYSNKYKGISYNIGVKLINTRRYLNDQNTDISSSKNFLNLMSQIGLKYEYGKSNEISLNYHNLLRQPRLSFLNSFNTSVDLQRVRIGNSDLKPQSTHTIELDFFNEFEKSSLTTTVYANFIKDIIQYSSTYDSENNITISRPENIGRASSYGIDFSYNANFPRWLNTIIKLNGEYGHISEENTTDNDFYRINTSIINLIRLNSYRIEFSWFYIPKSKINFQTFQSSNQHFKFGISKRVFKNNGNLVFSVIDPFNSAKIIQNIDGSNFQYSSEVRPNQRRFFISLFLRFSSKSKFRNTDKKKREKGILE